jgi:hypothetical protein
MYVNAPKIFSIFGVLREDKLSRKIIQLHTYVAMIRGSKEEKES